MRYRVIYDCRDEQWAVVDIGQHGRTVSIHETEQAARDAAQRNLTRQMSAMSALGQLVS